MKLSKRKLLAGALAVCLVAAITTGTLAYFTASRGVTNTFMTASTDPNDPNPPTETFGVKVTEKVPDPKDPTKTIDDNEKDYTYEDITPGEKLTKEPWATNTGLYPEYVRMKVTFDKWNVWQNTESYEKGVKFVENDLLKMLTGLNTGDEANQWKQADQPIIDGDKITFVFYYNSTLAAYQAPTEDGTEGTYASTTHLFNSVTIPAALDVAQMAALNADGGFSITVKAEAIQSENLPDGTDTPQDAFKLFDNPNA